MNFDIYAFGDVCIFVIPVVIFFSILFSAILGSLARRSSYGMQLLILLSYVFALGVVTHELAHRLFCSLFGVQVKETQFFKVTRKQTAGGEYISIGGYVDCADITSVIVALLLGFAPLFINGLLVALLFYYAPVIQDTAFYALAVYLGISLGLGTRISKEDLTLWVEALKKNPGRGLFELFCLISFAGLLYFLVTFIQIPIWGTLGLVLGFCTVVILITHVKPRSDTRRRLPGM